MAKSGRSKSVIKNKNLRRKLIYGPVEEERVKRLAAKQSVSGTPSTESAIQTSSEMQVEIGDSVISTLKNPSKILKKKKPKSSANKKLGRKKRTGFKWIPQKR
ncbi:hypothetical protein BB560_001816 [Smittium megazygosporum]|uniref:DUF2423 domain-containing protein n=1 Tax=Smittium megazygosporum TaxID=133381 RepID=A0A2T9ZGH4_9FUNG|nr:hypothetical protein BB560_001816 [Smittium megazygosporum]